MSPNSGPQRADVLMSNALIMGSATRVRAVMKVKERIVSESNERLVF